MHRSTFSLSSMSKEQILSVKDSGEVGHSAAGSGRREGMLWFFSWTLSKLCLFQWDNVLTL